MKTLLKPIFELITGEYTLFNNIIYNYIALFIIGSIVYKIAFKIVGNLYDSNIIFGSRIGSLIHWIVRFFVFTIIFYLCSTLIWLVKFIITIPIWAWIVAGVGLVVIISICMFIKNKKPNEILNDRKKVI